MTKQLGNLSLIAINFQRATTEFALDKMALESADLVLGFSLEHPGKQAITRCRVRTTKGIDFSAQLLGFLLG
jgi:hypothetical protein